MSSILKALKKLENEDSVQEIHGRYMPRSIDTRQTVNKRVKGFWIVNKVFSISCIVVFFLGITWFGLSYKQEKPTHEPVKSLQPAPVQPMPPIDKQPEIQEPVKQSVSQVSEIKKPDMVKPDIIKSGITKPGSTKIAKAETFRKPAPRPNPFKKPISEPIITANKMPKPAARPKPVLKPMPKPIPVPVKKTIEPIPEIQEKQIPQKKIQETALPEPEIHNKNLNPAHNTVPEKTTAESGLEIQALVWSPESHSRMAVINGNILREGGVIEGSVINYIGNDYIIFTKENKEWKLIFQIN